MRPKYSATVAFSRQKEKNGTKQTILALTQLGLGLLIIFVKVPRPGDSEVTFRSSSQAATYYYQSNHSKVEAIPLSALPKAKTSELADLYLHTIPF